MGRQSQASAGRGRVNLAQTLRASYFRGGEAKITPDRPAIYFSESEERAHWYAQSSDRDAFAREYCVRPKNTASVAELRRLVDEEIGPEVAAARARYAKSINDWVADNPSSPIAPEMDRAWMKASGLRDIELKTNLSSTSSSHLTQWEVDLLKKNGYDSLLGMESNALGGSMELAVFDESLFALKEPAPEARRATAEQDEAALAHPLRPPVLAEAPTAVAPGVGGLEP